MGIEDLNPLLLIGGMLALLVAVFSAIVAPRYWFYATVASFPGVMALEALPPGFSALAATPVKLLGLGALGGLAAHTIFLRKLPPMTMLLVALSALTLGAYVLSAVVTGSPYAGWFQRIVSGVVFFFLMDVWCQTEEDLATVKRVFATSAVVSILFGVVSGVGMVSEGVAEQVFDDSERQEAIFGNPNRAGAYALIALGLLVSMGMKAFNERRGLLAALSGAISVGLVYFIFSTGSRGSFFGLLAFGGVTMLFALPRLRSKLMLPLAAMGVFLALVAVAPDIFQQRIVDEIFGESEEAGLTKVGTFKIRMRINQSGLEQFVASPLVGSGPGNILDENKKRLGLRWAIHNRYVEVLASTGVLGTLPFLATLLATAWLFLRVIRRTPPERAVAVASDLGLFAGILVVSFGSSGVFEKATVFVMALASAHNNILRGNTAALPSSAPPVVASVPPAQQRQRPHFKNL